MRYLFKNDVAVQVWREERQVELEYAKFYKGIFDVDLRGLTHILFVPSFPKTPDNWPPHLPDNIDIVHSCHQARLFMAGLAEWTVTPDEELAGQREFIAVPPMRERSPIMDIGMLFYVTPEEFARFSQELLYIEKNHTLWANQYVALSKIKHFESMKFILDHILPLRQSNKTNGRRLIMNGAQVQIPMEEAREAMLLAQSATFRRLVEGGLGEIKQGKSRPVGELLNELPD